jgi:hypothetical protein
VDLNVVRGLADSPACLDFYCWLVWRCFNARGVSAISLDALKEQLGISENTAVRELRRQVRKWLTITRLLWPECPATISDDGSALLVARNLAITTRVAGPS